MACGENPFGPKKEEETTPGQSSDNSARESKKQTLSMVANSYSDLPECDDEIEFQLTYVKDESNFYTYESLQRSAIEIKGEKGETGATGPAGADGATGPAGSVSGVSPYGFYDGNNNLIGDFVSKIATT